MTLLDRLTSLTRHPLLLNIIDIIKRLRSSKSYWSVSYLVLIFTFREAIAWKFGSKIEEFTRSQIEDVPLAEYEELFWEAIAFIFANGSVELMILGTVIFLILSFVKVGESGRHEGSGKENYLAIFTLIAVLAISFVDLNDSQDIKKKIDQIVKGHEENNYFIEELKRKNREIDNLKERFDASDSEQIRLVLSHKISLLEEEKVVFQLKIKDLEERLKIYSSEVKIVKKSLEILNTKGIDEALHYLESIDFDKARDEAIESSKALLIQADLYYMKDEYENADETYQRSIRFDRRFDNSLAYSNYLAKQNRHLDAIRQLQIIDLDLELTKEQKATTLNNLANLYRAQNRLKDAETSYIEALDIYRALAKVNPSAYGIDFANTLVMGVYLLDQSKDGLDEADILLKRFKGIPRADHLLGLIETMRK